MSLQEGTISDKLNRSGYYEIKYTENMLNGRPRTKTQSTGQTSRLAAEIYLKEWTIGRNAAQASLRRETIGDVGERYIQDCINRKVNVSQIIRAKNVVRFFGFMFPEHITQADVDRYILSRNVGDGTIRGEVRVLYSIFKHGVKLKKFKMDDSFYVTYPAAPPPKALWLNETQEKEFYRLAMEDSVGKDRLTPLTRFIAIALATGSRKSAIHELTWDRVDLKSKVPTIDFRDSRRKETKKKRVHLPIPSSLLPLIKKAYAERLWGHLPDEELFVLDKAVWDKKLRVLRPSRSPAYMIKPYDEFVSRIGYSWVTPHVLRHTAASLLLRAGLDIWRTAKILGDTVATVDRVYGHHSSDYLLEAINIRDN